MSWLSKSRLKFVILGLCFGITLSACNSGEASSVRTTSTKPISVKQQQGSSSSSQSSVLSNSPSQKVLTCELGTNKLNSVNMSAWNSFFEEVPASKFTYDPSSLDFSDNPQTKILSASPGIWKFYLPIPSNQFGYGSYIAYQQKYCWFAVEISQHGTNPSDYQDQAPGYVDFNIIYSDGSNVPTMPACWSESAPSYAVIDGRITIHINCKPLGET